MSTTTKVAPTAGPRCGSYAGYLAHRRRGESACQACREAVSARNRLRRSTLAGREAIRAANRRFRSTPEGREATNAASRRAHHAALNRLRARTEAEADADFRAKWPGGKPCPGCGELLPASAFHRQWTTTDGRQRRCDRNGCRHRHARQKQLDKLRAHWVARGLDPDLCAYCGEAPIEHVDHFYPSSKGGPDHPDNYVGSCPKDNLAKSDRDPFEWLAAAHPDRLDFFRALFTQETPA